MTERDYRILFDAEEPEGILAELLPPPRERCGKMRYITRRTLAGDIQYVDIYPRFGPDQERRARTARKAASPEKMERANQRARERRLAALMNTNFGQRDYFLTLTYAREVSRETAQKDVRNFLRRADRLREKRGLEKQKYIYCLEDSDTEGGRVRTHVHLAISGGLSRDELEQLWGHGFANADRLQPDERGLEGLAKYFLKTRGAGSREHPNRRSWSCSKNLKKPVVRKSASRFSTAKVRRMVEDLRVTGQEELEKAFPDYLFVDLAVHYSDTVEGVYLEAVLRKR